MAGGPASRRGRGRPAGRRWHVEEVVRPFQRPPASSSAASARVHASSAAVRSASSRSAVASCAEVVRRRHASSRASGSAAAGRRPARTSWHGRARRGRGRRPSGSARARRIPVRLARGRPPPRCAPPLCEARGPPLGLAPFSLSSSTLATPSRSPVAVASVSRAAWQRASARAWRLSPRLAPGVASSSRAPAWRSPLGDGEVVVDVVLREVVHLLQAERARLAHREQLRRSPIAPARWPQVIPVPSGGVGRDLGLVAEPLRERGLIASRRSPPPRRRRPRPPRWRGARGAGATCRSARARELGEGGASRSSSPAPGDGVVEARLLGADVLRRGRRRGQGVGGANDLRRPGA